MIGALFGPCGFPGRQGADADISDHAKPTEVPHGQVRSLIILPYWLRPRSAPWGASVVPGKKKGPLGDPKGPLTLGVKFTP